MNNLQNIYSIGILNGVNGNDLKAFRERCNFTQESLAKELRVAANTVARWERNERRIPEFLELALQTIERNLQLKNKIAF